MPNITITNIDLGSVVLDGRAWADGLIDNVEITEQTFAAGTILARSVSTGKFVPYAPAAVEDTIVDVTVDVADIPANTAPDTAVTVPGAKVGDIVTIQPLGTWPVGLGQPTGRVLVDGTVQMRTPNVTAGAINPGSQDFRFSLNHDVARPAAVLTYPVTVAASSSAAARVLIDGEVNQGRLVIHDETAITAHHLDALRGASIVAVAVNQLSKVDNPQ